ncbi:MAG TPA: type III PLP-dependent enzyme, partial [Propylenella sp.]|nr:type III PLP-dependent enzyme [Propylenella sp.]
GGHALTGFQRDARTNLPRYRNVDAVVAQLKPSEPIFCIRPAELRMNSARFKGFPGRALYAVKCNPHPFVLETLYEAGIRDFDVASLQEIELVGRLFGKAAGMFFNNPAKSRPSLQSASGTHGIRFYTVDQASELEKIMAEARRDDDLVVAVRLATRPRDARYALSTKFGAPADECIPLLRAVHRAGIRAGLSFHVGSQCLAPDAFSAALSLCGHVIKKAGVPISVLNVGGGFPAPYPGDTVGLLEQYFASIIFGYHGLRLPPGCLLLCEPGRSLVATAASVVAQVTLRKHNAIYINDGVFGSLQELRHPKERRPTRLVRQGAQVSGRLADFRVYGPTCDSDDVLGAPFSLPDDVREGDWIEIGMMGAYSLAMRTQFNGFSVQEIATIDE